MAQNSNRRNYRIRYDRIIYCAIILVVMILLVGAVLVCAVKGGMKTAYIPAIELTGTGSPFMVAGIIAYVIFMAIPTVLNIAEALRWHYLRSGI